VFAIRKKIAFKVNREKVMITARWRVLALAGTLAPIWIFFGVAITSSQYPGYSQYNQALSELGAVGSPTQFLSPGINNFPLAVLFVAFGVSICMQFCGSRAAIASGILIIIHGIGTLVAGLFSCDIGCKMESPSHSQIIHSTAGAVMFLSLTLASLIWVKVGNRLLELHWFSQFSLIFAALSLVALYLLLTTGHSGGLGLYQRLNYGFSLVWLFVLAVIVSSRRFPSGNNCDT